MIYGTWPALRQVQPLHSGNIPCQIKTHNTKCVHYGAGRGGFSLCDPAVTPARGQLFAVRVRYGADGAPKNEGPRPFSPPRPTQRPGAGCLFRHSLPLSPLKPPPHPYPRRVPVKNRWYQTGPRPGNECGWAPDGGGAGITQKIPSPAPCKGGVLRVKNRPARPRNEHYLPFLPARYDTGPWLGCGAGRVFYFPRWLPGRPPSSCPPLLSMCGAPLIPTSDILWLNKWQVEI